MSKVFQVKPKRIKRVNNTVLTPEMVVTGPPSSTLPPLFIMEPRRCKRCISVSMLSITRKHAAMQMILSL